MPYYFITLTTSCGFSEENLNIFVTAFNSLKHAFVVNEFGRSDQFSHIQGLVEYDSVKTSNVTLRLKRLYAAANIDVSPHSITVKKATDFVGALIYSKKELDYSESSSKLIVIRGWSQSWIDDQVKNNVAKIPYKMLKKKLHRVTQMTGGALMFEWCVANNRMITGKFDYLQIVKAMAKEHYGFGTIRHKSIFQDVMSCFGDGIAAFQVAESELLFIQ